MQHLENAGDVRMGDPVVDGLAPTAAHQQAGRMELTQVAAGHRDRSSDAFGQAPNGKAGAAAIRHAMALGIRAGLQWLTDQQLDQAQPKRVPQNTQHAGTAIKRHRGQAGLWTAPYHQIILPFR